MKAYKIEILYIDHEEFGPEGLEDMVEQGCESWGLPVIVKKVEEREIGEWSDDHPLNINDEYGQKYYEELFK